MTSRPIFALLGQLGMSSTCRMNYQRFSICIHWPARKDFQTINNFFPALHSALMPKVKIDPAPLGRYFWARCNICCFPNRITYQETKSWLFKNFMICFVLATCFSTLRDKVSKPWSKRKELKGLITAPVSRSNWTRTFVI